MIGFFRRIRKNLANDNKPMKYMRYAIGEILLVVIGILIALSLNNWNGNRIAREIEKGQLMNLVEDLKLDSLSFDRSLKRIYIIKALHKELYDIGIKGINKNISLSPGIVRWGLGINPRGKRNMTILINELKNKTIRNQIIKYLDLLESTEYPIEDFRSIIKGKIRIFIGQQGMYNVSQQFEDNSVSQAKVISTENLIALSKNKDFQQLLFEANFKLKAVETILPDLISKNNLLRRKIKSELKKY